MKQGSKMNRAASASRTGQRALAPTIVLMGSSLRGAALVPQPLQGSLAMGRNAARPPARAQPLPERSSPLEQLSDEAVLTPQGLPGQAGSYPMGGSVAASPGTATGSNAWLAEASGPPPGLPEGALVPGAAALAQAAEDGVPSADDAGLPLPLLPAGVGQPEVEAFLAEAEAVAAQVVEAAMAAAAGAAAASAPPAGSGGGGVNGTGDAARAGRQEEQEGGEQGGGEREEDSSSGEASDDGRKAAALAAAEAAVAAWLSPERLQRLFPFQLDDFQAQSAATFLQGKSVVVCAPTGAGKTAIAEACAAATLAMGKRVIYTTPLKALSNQKLYETRARFGAQRCGLQTGDTSLNTEADIVIMTTEILRNIMYRTAELVDANAKAGSGAASANTSNTREQRLGDVGLIVLDEVHYLGNPERGSVWEEVIINCPRHIQLLCMSATVRNPEDLGGWISKEHQECATITTRFRPVPLTWQFAYKSPKAGNLALDDLLEPNSNGKVVINPALDTRAVLAEEARYMAQQQAAAAQAAAAAGEWYGGNGAGGGANGSAYGSYLPRGSKRLLSQVGVDPSDAARSRVYARRIPTLEALILRLRKLGYLPAIKFIMSRKGCDEAAVKAGGIVLTTPQEQKEIRAELEALEAVQPDVVPDALVEPLLAGSAAHHAGHLPGWRQLVERLFQRGLLKMVFATGTLAAGINMPARTTIISALSRKTDEGPLPLPHNELLQMAGRAGRRGFDTLGHCIVVQTRYDGPEDAVAILRRGPEPLVSQFSASYGLVLNLLSIYTMEEAKEFVARSFGNYMQLEGNTEKMAQVADLEARARALMAQHKEEGGGAGGGGGPGGLKELTSALSSARRELRELRAAAVDEQAQQVAQALISVAKQPAKVMLNLVKQPSVDKPLLMPAVVIGAMAPEAPPNADRDWRLPFYIALAADNRLLRVSVTHVVALAEEEAPDVTAEDAAKIAAVAANVREASWQAYAPKLGTCQVALGSATTAAVSLKLQKAGMQWRGVDMSEAAAARMEAQRAVVKAAYNRVQSEKTRSQGRPGREGGGAGAAAGAMSQARKLLRRAEALRAESQQVSDGVWRSFTDVSDILIRTEAMDGSSLKPRPLGLVARNLQGQNELWLAMALTHPALMDLGPAQLAALVGALLSPEVLRRPLSVWAAYTCSEVVVRTVEQLEAQRDLLYGLQSAAGLHKWNDYLLPDLRLAGIVEAWAAGASWRQIMADTTLDDGDVARLLIRVSDMLRQIIWNAHLLPHLRGVAAEALKGVDRPPVAEVLPGEYGRSSQKTAPTAGGSGSGGPSSASNAGSRGKAAGAKRSQQQNGAD